MYWLSSPWNGVSVWTRGHVTAAHPGSGRQRRCSHNLRGAQVARIRSVMSYSANYGRLEEGASPTGWPTRQQLTALMEEDGKDAIDVLTSGGGVPKLVSMLGSSVTEGIAGTPTDLAERQQAFGANEFETKQLKVWRDRLTPLHAGVAPIRGQTQRVRERRVFGRVAVSNQQPRFLTARPTPRGLSLSTVRPLASIVVPRARLGRPARHDHHLANRDVRGVVHGRDGVRGSPRDGLDRVGRHPHLGRHHRQRRRGDGLL